MTREQQVALAPETRVVGVRFRPGMAAGFLGIPVAHVTDVSAPLEDIWPRRARELMQSLDDAPLFEDAAQVWFRALQTCIPALNPVRRALSHIAQQTGNVSLSEVAAQANLSERQFRRRCLEESGLTPKLLARVLRFRRAYESACASRHLNWARIAAENGYFDQAHLVRDFRQFCGSAPTSVFSKRNAVRPLYP